MLGRNLSLYKNILLHRHITVFYHSDIATYDDWKQLRYVVIVLTVHFVHSEKIVQLFSLFISYIGFLIFFPRKLALILFSTKWYSHVYSCKKRILVQQKRKKNILYVSHKMTSRLCKEGKILTKVGFTSTLTEPKKRVTPEP